MFSDKNMFLFYSCPALAKVLLNTAAHSEQNRVVMCISCHCEIRKPWAIASWLNWRLKKKKNLTGLL